MSVCALTVPLTVQMKIKACFAAFSGVQKYKRRGMVGGNQECIETYRMYRKPRVYRMLSALMLQVPTGS